MADTVVEVSDGNKKVERETLLEVHVPLRPLSSRKRFLNLKWLLGLLLVLVVEALSAYCYYVYVYVYLIGTVTPLPLMLVLLVLFHGMLILQQSSYLRSIQASPGEIPIDYIKQSITLWRKMRLATIASEVKKDDSIIMGLSRIVQSRLNASTSTPAAEEQNDNVEEWDSEVEVDIEKAGLLSQNSPRDPEKSPLLGIEQKEGGGIRICGRCHKPKPDRCHHCSMCNRCVLKMDHHCPWVNNCVGWGNYKYFMLFLIWTCISTLFVAISLLPELITLNFSELTADKVQMVIATVITGIFGLCLLAFCAVHFQLIFRNVTTIENMEKPDRRRNMFGSQEEYRNPFDLGARRNFEQVFGEDPLLWFIPVDTSVGNGTYFSLNEAANCRQKEVSQS